MSVNVHNQGIGFARPNDLHQCIISNIISSVKPECRKSGLWCAPESTITKDVNDVYPDVTIFDRNHNPLVIFELTHNSGMWYDRRKCVNIIKRFKGVECFILNYEREVIYFFDYETNTWITSNDYKIYSSYLKNPIEYYFCDDPEEILNLYGEYNIKQILPELKEKYL